MAHPIEGLMNSALQNLKSMVDVNTIIGEPIIAGDGIVIIPVSKVSFGLAVGGSNFGDKANDVSNQSFGGGSGAGVSISPMAFLVVSNNTVRMMPMSQTNAIDKIIDMAPDVIEKLLKKFEKSENEPFKAPEPAAEDDFVIG